jgi:hypothetical protein
MSEFRPLLHDDPTERERLLLGSARLDVPAGPAKGRVLAALGFAAVTTAAGTGGATTVAATGTALVIKLLAVGALGGVVALGAIEGLTPPGRPGVGRRGAATVDVGSLAEPHQGAPAAALLAGRATVASTIAMVPAANGTSAAMAAPSVAVTPAIAAAPSLAGVSCLVAMPAVAATPADHLGPGNEPVSAGPPPRPTLAAEVLALDEARHALASGDAAKSLRLLDDFDRRVTQPALMPEATVLRVETLVALGRIDEARALVDGLLAAHPDTPYAQRLRSLVVPVGLRPP